MWITETFYSIQGESIFSGFPCGFVRTTGCNLRCSWCDSEHSFHGGMDLTIESIMSIVKSWIGCRIVEITGGEPLLQKCGVYELADVLHREGYVVLLETSGSICISDVPKFIHIIMDIKAPGSSMEHKNDYGNIALLKCDDELKVVISDRSDYTWVKELLSLYNVPCVVTLSPSHGELEPAVLAGWILSDGLNVRLQLQIHKYIGVE